jgi:hypothetical protein
MSPEQTSNLHQFFESSLHKKAEEQVFEANRFKFKIENPSALTKVFDPQQLDKPLIFILSGPTESGKSTFGQTLAGDKIATRFKILKHVRELLETDVFVPPPQVQKDDPTGYLTYVKTLPEPEILRIGDILVSTTAQKLESWDTPIAVIETVSHTWVINAFKNDQSVRALSIFLDPIRSLRIKREAEKEKISIQAAQQIIDIKDTSKSAAGLWECRTLSDIYVQNSGIIDEYCKFIRELGSYAMNTTRKFNGIPFEYK